MKYLNFILIVIFVLLGFSTCISAYQDVYVRVAIIKDAQSLDLAVDGLYKIVDSNNTVIYKGTNLKTKVKVCADTFNIEAINLKQDNVIIKPIRQAAVKINNRRFRGDIRLAGKETGILVINYLNIEDYLKGVLYHEISHYWPMEILKAQAVVSRTFALYQTIVNKDKDFDLTADIYSQVYGGRTSERYRTTKAVNKTKGIIITFKGNVFPAYFHATCGGFTEDASRLWNIDLAPLKGVICNFCKKSPHFKWSYSISLDDIRKALSKSGYKINIIKDITILDRNNSGRLSNLEIITDGESIKILAKDFRNLIGPNLIRSTNFKVRLDGNIVEFQGIGWGHGVGMCQWGAYFMAKRQASFKDIIRYYYPGVQISNVNTIKRL